MCNTSRRAIWSVGFLYVALFKPENAKIANECFFCIFAPK